MDTTTGISPSSVEALALRILGGCRGVVYRQYPHLDAALAGLVPEFLFRAESACRLCRLSTENAPEVSASFAAWPVPACDWRKAV